MKQQSAVNSRASLGWAVPPGLWNSTGPGTSFLLGALSFSHPREAAIRFVQGIGRETKCQVPASPVAT